MEQLGLEFIKLRLLADVPIKQFTPDEMEILFQLYGTRDTEVLQEILEEKKKGAVKQKLKELLSTVDCYTAIRSLEYWELDVIKKIYGTASGDTLCGLLVKKALPIELIRNVFLFSKSKDIVSWQNSELMDNRTFMRKKDSDIIEAAKNGNILGVKYLSSIASTEEKNEALFNAAEFGDLEIVKYLIKEAGANVHYRDDLALKAACAEGHIEIVKYLVEEEGGDIYADDNEPTRWAARKGHLEVVKYLVSKGTMYDSLLSDAVEGNMEGNMEVIKYLVSEARVNIHLLNERALHTAISNLVFHGEERYIEIINYLVENGANPRVRSESYIWYLIKNKKLELASYLIKLGVDVHYEGDSALAFACMLGYLDIVKELVEAGADIHAHRTRGISGAAKFGHLEIIKYLVSRGAIPHQFAFAYAARLKHVEITKYLSDMTVVSQDVLNETLKLIKINNPRDIKPAREVVDILLQKGANPDFIGIRLKRFLKN